MKSWLLVVLMLPVVLAWAVVTPSAADDDFRRERTPENSKAKDALEGKAPPALVVSDWMNLPSGVEALDWSRLKGKVVVIDFWGTW